MVQCIAHQEQIYQLSSKQPTCASTTEHQYRKHEIRC